MRMSAVTRIICTAVCVAMGTAVAIIGPAFAAGANHGRVWESGLGGINVNAQVWIQASYSDGGKHASGGRVHLWRAAGPAVNVWGYTPAASSPSDSRTLTVKKTVKDSVLPGDRYVTHGSWGYSWFGGGGCFSDEQAIIPPC